MANREHDCFVSSDVLDSRPVHRGRIRVRKCRICKKKFHTQELSMEDEMLPEVAKIDAEKVKESLRDMKKSLSAVSRQIKKAQSNLEFLWPKGLK